MARITWQYSKEVALIIADRIRQSDESLHGAAAPRAYRRAPRSCENSPWIGSDDDE